MSACSNKSEQYLESPLTLALMPRGLLSTCLMQFVNNTIFQGFKFLTHFTRGKGVVCGFKHVGRPGEAFNGMCTIKTGVHTRYLIIYIYTYMGGATQQAGNARAKLNN